MLVCSPEASDALPKKMRLKYHSQDNSKSVKLSLSDVHDSVQAFSVQAVSCSVICFVKLIFTFRTNLKHCMLFLSWPLVKVEIDSACRLLVQQRTYHTKNYLS